MAIDRIFASRQKQFGDIGPKLLSDYMASDAGAELGDWVFSPVLFNSINWTETDLFHKPLSELADYLNDERVFGVHLWNKVTDTVTRDSDTSLISMLSDPRARLPRLISLADRFNTDKNRRTGNRHFYSRVYDRLLSPRRFSLRQIMEIGVCGGREVENQKETPSVALWQSYFPFGHVTGVDLIDCSRLSSERFSFLLCDQSKRDDLRAVAAKIDRGSLDVVIDDGSHASFDQQLTLREFFPLLADGGWYFIESLDSQPSVEDDAKITPTNILLQEVQKYGVTRSADPLGIGALSGEITEILFFDSHSELSRSNLLGGLVAIRKRGGSGLGG